MRRNTVPFALLLLAGVGVLPAPGASAQPAPMVRLLLVSQSVSNGPNQPLDIRVQATNTQGTALRSLRIELTIDAPARSRTAYELSLRTDATSTILTLPFPQNGELAPDQTREFHIVQPLDALPLLSESALYPVKLELLSADEVVATIRTPMIFLTEHPRFPLNLAWTWVFSEPVEFGPDGVFVADASIQRDVAPGGRVDAAVTALERTTAPVDLVVSPVLLDELARMARGYRVLGEDGKPTEVPKGTGASADAARVLGGLRQLAGRPGTELVAQPLGDPSLPALSAGGLLDGLSFLTARGRDVARTLLQANPSTTVARPPLSRLDGASLSRLAQLGTVVILLDPGVIPSPPGLQFTPPAMVRVTAEGASVQAVVPDAGTAAAAAADRSDPILAARAALGELAATWFEFPGTPGRGAAVTFSDTARYRPEFLTAFTEDVAASPWLHPISATEMAGVAPAVQRQALPPQASPAFELGYVARLLQARIEFQRYRSAVLGAEAKGQVTALSSDLQLAQGGTFVGNPALGDRFVEAVHGAIARTYGRVHPPAAGTLITLTSRSGTLPITVRNDSPYELQVQVRLIADRRLLFPHGNMILVRLQPRANTAFRFAVRAQTTGRFPMKVQVLGPDAHGAPMAESQMVIRSTAYNRVALLVTVGAGLFLLGWWGRRFLPRRKS
jgi:hypothetical protein